MKKIIVLITETIALTAIYSSLLFLSGRQPLSTVYIEGHPFRTTGYNLLGLLALPFLVSCIWLAMTSLFKSSSTMKTAMFTSGLSVLASYIAGALLGNYTGVNRTMLTTLGIIAILGLIAPFTGNTLSRTIMKKRK